MKKSSLNVYLVASLLVAVTCATSVVAGGNITGKVLFKGTSPEEKSIDMVADAACKAMYSESVTTRHYIVNPDGTLANVFVSMKSGLEGKTFDAPKTTVELDQKQCLYQPYVMGVQVNQELEILNSDDTLHNVHATPKVNEEFNKGQPVKGMKFRHKFTKTESPVRFKCDVHPWMFAYVHVVPHPFFATTGESGTFKIEGLPPGQYVIEAWHHKASGGAAQPAESGTGFVQSQTVTVGEGETKAIEFTFEAK